MLTKDVLNCIFLKLDDESLNTVRLVCKKFKEIVDDKMFWYNKTLQLLNLETLEYRAKDNEYKKYYLNVKKLILENSDNPYYVSAIAQSEGYLDLLKYLPYNSVMEIYIDGNKTYKYYVNPFRRLFEGKYTIYKNNRIKETYMYKNGKKNGTYIKRYENGLIKERGNFTDGKKNGLFINYDSDGGLHTESYYKDNLLNGSYKVYINGVLFIEMNYKNAIAEGEYKSYYGENILREEGRYHNGEKVGEWKYYDFNV